MIEAAARILLNERLAEEGISLGNTHGSDRQPAAPAAGA